MSLDEWNTKMAVEHARMMAGMCANEQREWTEKRDAAIVGAHREGASLRAIADAVGMSHMGVKRIVQRDS